MQKIISFDDSGLDHNVPSIINVDFFTSKQSSLPIDYIPDDEKKKRGRPRKKLVDGQELLTGDSGKDLPMYQTAEPYRDSYDETEGLLKNSIVQIDTLQSEMKGELDLIRQSKTLKRKYDYMTLLTNTMSSLITTKVTAIREINKTITDCHNLEIKRIKDLKMGDADQDDDKRIMDMYNAYISTPVGTYNTPNAYNPPSQNELTLLNSGVMGTDMYQNNQGYTMNPSVNKMLMMENPNIKTVVLYNSTTGERKFDVINTQTGESIPGADRPDPMFLNDTSIDVRNGIARNTNLDQTYKLVVIDNPDVSQY